MDRRSVREIDRRDLHSYTIIGTWLIPIHAFPLKEESVAEKPLTRSKSRRGSRKGRGHRNSVTDKSADAEKGEEDGEEEEEVDEELKAEVEKNSMKNLGRLWKMNAPETPYLLLGSFGALLVGGTNPGMDYMRMRALFVSALSLLKL